MPSLPTSLIVVVLVAAWLVVLVPMVAGRRERVPENTDDGVNMRVLDRRGRRGRRRAVLSRTAMAHRTRPAASAYDAVAGVNDDPARTDETPAVAVDSDIDGTTDEFSGVAPSAAVDTPWQRASTESRSTRERVVDNDTVPSYRAALVDAVPFSAARPFSAASRDAAIANAGTSFARTSHTASPGAARFDAVPVDAAPFEGLPAAAAPVRTAMSAADAPGYGAEDAPARAVPTRSGRGGYDPAAAKRASDYRFRQRRRVALALLVIGVAGAAAGLWGYGYGYVAAISGGVLLVLYLAYLRRQTQIEADIRRRRAARYERAQQIRPGYRPSVAEQVYAHRTGETPRPGVVGDYAVRSHVRPVSAAGGRYGVPVDFDDDDPVFDDLEYYRPAHYGRRAG